MTMIHPHDANYQFRERTPAVEPQIAILVFVLFVAIDFVVVRCSLI